jgi:hypothetical protein
LIDEHGTAILFDLQGHGVDLYDLWRSDSGLTPRKVLFLVGQLPMTSAYAASVRGGAEFRPWDTQLYVLAAIANILNAANRQRAGKRSAQPVIKPPKPQQQRKPRVLSVAEIMRRQQHAHNN